jgi:hypothetical protein
MKEEKVNEIMAKVEEAWKKTIKERLDEVRQMLLDSPHEDGCQRVIVIGSTDGKKHTYLVPFEFIITKGLRGDEVEGKFPEVKE